MNSASKHNPKRRLQEDHRRAQDSRRPHPRVDEARDDKRLLRLQRQLTTYKLLLIDKLGYVTLSTTGAEPLFEVFSQRCERGSTIVFQSAV